MATKANTAALLILFPRLLSTSYPGYDGSTGGLVNMFSIGDCPSTMNITNFGTALTQSRPGDLMFIKIVKSADIVEDGEPCPAAKPSLDIGEDTVPRPVWLFARTQLTKNANAVALIKQLDQSAFATFGFSKGARRCQSRKYEDGTFYFFLNNPTVFSAALWDVKGDPLTIRIRPATAVLLILGPKNEICALRYEKDKHSDLSNATPSATVFRGGEPVP